MRGIRGFLNITGASERTRSAVCSAIKSRRVIEFYYHDSYRTAEPFCLGVVMTDEADNESLLCYQVGGHSEYGSTVGWKLYRASEISELEITGERFSGDRPGCDPDNMDMTTIYCCVIPETDSEVRAREVPKVAPVPCPETPRETVTRSLTHNELMKRFRFTHPVPMSELYTNICI